MRRAQFSIFLIVGVIIVFSIVLIVVVARSVANPSPPSSIQSSEVLARTCLAQTTKAALHALANDGVITDNENGPSTLPYFFVRNDGLPLGMNNYLGLCDEGQGCDSLLVNPLFNTQPSIQEQLAVSINRGMTTCFPESGRADVSIQTDSLHVTWTKPAVEHTEFVPLMLVWRAIEETVRREVSETDFNPSDSLECAGCSAVSVRLATALPKSLDSPVDYYEFVVNGDVIATIGFENRNIFYVDNSGSAEVWRSQVNELVCSSSSCEYYFFQADKDATYEYGNSHIISVVQDSANPAFSLITVRCDGSSSESTGLRESQTLNTQNYEFPLTVECTS